MPSKGFPCTLEPQGYGLVSLPLPHFILDSYQSGFYCPIYSSLAEISNDILIFSSNAIIRIYYPKQWLFLPVCLSENFLCLGFQGSIPSRFFSFDLVCFLHWIFSHCLGPYILSYSRVQSLFSPFAFLSSLLG